jgi:hypothetical protein
MTRTTDPSPAQPAHGPRQPASGQRRPKPARRRSELREALDAATGRDQDGHEVPSAGPATEAPPAGSKETGSLLAPFFGGVISNALGGILAAILLALGAFLWAHVHHPGHPPAQRPVAPASASAAGRQ